MYRFSYVACVWRLCLGLLVPAAILGFCTLVCTVFPVLEVYVLLVVLTALLFFLSGVPCLLGSGSVFLGIGLFFCLWYTPLFNA